MNSVGQNYDLTPRLDNLGGYNLLKIWINDVLIKEESILDFQVNYGLEEKGFLSFTDSIGIIEIAPLTFSVLEVILEDKLKVKQEKKYIITKVETFRDQHNLVTIDIEFEEYNTYKLKNSFISKSYKNKTIIQIIKDLFNQLNIEAEFYNESEGYIYEYFVTPGNMTVFEFIEKQSMFADFKYFVDRIGWVFSTRDALDFSKLSFLQEDIFSFTNKMPYWKILEYKGKISNIKEARKGVSSYIQYTDIKNLNYNPKKITVDDLYKDQEVNGNIGIKDMRIPDVLSPVGFKQISNIYSNSIKGDSKDFREYLQQMQDISIAVQGVVGVRMYGKIKVDIPRSNYNKNDNPDSVFSGYFIVVGVVDKIMAGKYIQILKLRSSDYGRFKE